MGCALDSKAWDSARESIKQAPSRARARIVELTDTEGDTFAFALDHLAGYSTAKVVDVKPEDVPTEERRERDHCPDCGAYKDHRAGCARRFET